MLKTIKLLVIFVLIYTTSSAKDYVLSSPDKKNTIIVTVDKTISWSVTRNSEILIKPSKMSLFMENGNELGKMPVVLKATTATVDKVITAIIPVKNKIIPDEYTELRLLLKGSYAIEFRAYNDGVAYRFTT